MHPQRPPDTRAVAPPTPRDPLPTALLTAAEADTGLALALAEWWRDRREPQS